MSRSRDARFRRLLEVSSKHWPSFSQTGLQSPPTSCDGLDEIVDSERGQRPRLQGERLVFGAFPTSTELGGDRWKIAAGASALLLTGRAFGAAFASACAPPEVVWSYGNENEDQLFVHVEFRTPGGVRDFTADFDVRWEA